ncbi:hypothetical protein JCM3770_001682 [Rhodotorula araucariae]
MSTRPCDGIRTFKVRLQGDDVEHLAALGRAGEQFVLVLAEQSARDKRGQDGAVLTAVSVLVEADPFPGLTMDGRPMIWVKNYSENAGVLEQLEKARVLRPTGSTIKQGLVNLPLAEVVISENEQAHRCALERCEAFESVEVAERFKRCSSCRRRYYHQHAHWPRHKTDCKDLAAGRFVQVENRRRAQHDLPVAERVEEFTV